jgi:hypothetical protein
MAVNSQILVPHSDGPGIVKALQALLGAHPLPWRVTIRPSRRSAHWSVEISRPGLFLVCAASPRRQTPGEISRLVERILQRAPVALG